MSKCWMCGANVEFESGELTKHCPDCGVEVDIINQDTTKQEVKVPFETVSSGVGEKSIYIKLPKEGESYDFSIHGKITNIQKVENVDHKKGKFNFTRKVDVQLPSGKTVKTDEDCGYFYSLEFADGSKLSMSSWSPFYAMKRADVTEGDVISVDHKGKGEWVISKA